MNGLIRGWPQACGLLLLGCVVLFSTLGPSWWPDYATQDLVQFLAPPDAAEPFGRDHLGRSVMARLASAAQLSLWLGLLCVLTAAALGSLLGVLSAWRGGWLDAVLRSIADGVLALPGLLIVLIFSAMTQGGFVVLYIGLALAQWVEYFRMVRARSRQILASPHVEASRLLGFGPVYIVQRHLWPELAPMLLTMMSFGLATAIVALSTLGFVGVGVKPPIPELGQMMTEALPFYSEAPWLLLAPVGLLAITLSGLVLLRPEDAHS